MANGVGWKTAELQIETLIPGILLTFGANAAFGNYFSTMLKTIVPHNAFLQGTLLLAIAYSGGVISAIPCRAILDRLSEAGVRAWLFSRLVHADRSKLLQSRLKKDRRFRDDYWYERKNKSRQKGIAFWNAAYRSALRTTSRSIEVDRRRSQGRVLRNLSLPLAVWVTVPFPETPGCKSIAFVLGLIFFLAFVLPYSYAEYVNFAEAYDISQDNRRNKKGKTPK
jgi:hypothetical protein